MKRKSLAKFVLMVVVFWLVSASWAAPLKPVLFYSKAEKGLFNKTYTFRFSLWDAETGGNRVWEEEKAVKTKNSVINTYLGEVNSLEGVNFGQALWVLVEKKETDGTYVQVGEMDELVGVPYAMWALTPAGPKGDKGDQGLQGPKGDKGDTGPTGPMGAQGPQGLVGATGPIGPQGPQGPIGVTGPQGPQGVQGATGPPGPQGPTGPVGPSGASVYPVYYKVTQEFSCPADCTWYGPVPYCGNVCPSSSDYYRISCASPQDTIVEYSLDKGTGFVIDSWIEFGSVSSPGSGIADLEFHIHNGELWAVVMSATIRCLGLRPW